MGKLEEFSHKKGMRLRETLSLLVESMALTISNQCDPDYYDEREKRFMEITKDFSSDDLQNLGDLFGQIMFMFLAQIDGPSDILGSIYMELSAGKKQLGQVFTPDHICRLMAALTGTPPEKEIAEKGFVTVCDPACGSGAMILGFAYGMKEAGIAFTKMFAECTDIDIEAVHMTYVQLALSGIPAVVIHGNTLTDQQRSMWWTPACAELEHMKNNNCK